MIFNSRLGPDCSNLEHISDRLVQHAEHHGDTLVSILAALDSIAVNSSLTDYRTDFDAPPTDRTEHQRRIDALRADTQSSFGDPDAVYDHDAPPPPVLPPLEQTLDRLVGALHRSYALFTWTPATTEQAHMCAVEWADRICDDPLLIVNPPPNRSTVHSDVPDALNTLVCDLHYRYPDWRPKPDSDYWAAARWAERLAETVERFGSAFRDPTTLLDSMSKPDEHMPGFAAG